MGTQPECQEQRAEAKCGCSPHHRPRPSLLGDQALRGLPGGSNAHSAISGLASARTALAQSWQPLPGPGPHPGCGRRRVGWAPHECSPHLRGSLCSLASQAPHRLQAHPGKIRRVSPTCPCWGTRDSVLTQTSGCCLVSPKVLPCLCPGCFPCCPVLAGTPWFSLVRPSFQELGSG